MNIDTQAQRNNECRVTLLPYNATEFEKSVEQAVKYNVDPEILAGFKFKTTGSNINLALSWEYSLAQINVDDFKDRVIEGLKFHRLQGTPYSLSQALSWYNLKNITIEEEEPGQHFAEFLVDFKEIPDSVTVQTIIDAAQLAKPLRSRLSRMYTPDYDIRRFILNTSPWGNLLDDDSGIYFRDTNTKISFGRRMWANAEFFGYKFYYYHLNYKFAFGKIEDTFKLDWGILDDTRFGEANKHNFYDSLKSSRNKDYVGSVMANAQVIKPMTFSRAMIVLDDQVELDGLQSCFGSNYETKDIEEFTLDFSALDYNMYESRNIIADVRYFNSSSFDGSYKFEIKTTTPMYARYAFFHGYLSDTLVLRPFGFSERSTTVTYQGNNTWHDHRHFNVPWNEQNFYTEIIGQKAKKSRKTKRIY